MTIQGLQSLVFSNAIRGGPEHRLVFQKSNRRGCWKAQIERDRRGIAAEGNQQIEHQAADGRVEGMPKRNSDPAIPPNLQEPVWGREGG